MAPSHSLLSLSTSVFFSRLPVSCSLLRVTGAPCSGGGRWLCGAAEDSGGGAGAAPPDGGCLM